MHATTSRPGRGWFLTGTILLVLTGIAHTIGQFTPDEPDLAAVLNAMRTSNIPMGLGMAPSLMGIFRDLAFTMSIMFFALAAMNLLFIYGADATTRLRRTAAGINLVWLTVFILLAYSYKIPPPLISALVIWPLFLLAYIKSRDALPETRSHAGNAPKIN